ncbi:phage holin family protein [Rubrivirga sp. IMCC45206]|uniref:phage holin family protein n=1 Tax=Rubrivirga sp. IMCC45206 TaxID=3391614 RepID=UPI00398FE37B
MARPPHPVPPPVVPLPTDPPPPAAAPPSGRPAPPVYRAPVPRMETLPAPVGEPSPTLADRPTIAPETRMLPPHQTKLDRVTGHVAALSEDLREWVELRIDLVKRQVEGVVGQLERVQHYLDAAAFFVPAALLAITAVLFLFVTVALLIGDLVGSVWGGFAITTVLMLVVAGLLGWVGMKKVKESQQLAMEAKRASQNAQSLTREQIQEAQRQSAARSAV